MRQLLNHTSGLLMHPRTQATLDQLRSVEWFRKVGIRDSDAVEFLSSWEEAIESSSSPDWEDLCQEAVNQYSQRLAERSPEQYRRWNDIVADVKPAVEALVAEKTQQAVETHQLPKEFIDTVRWGILHLCLEAEYADVYPPGFYASHSYWYAQGHFPCGYKGTFPHGKLIVF